MKLAWRQLSFRRRSLVWTAGIVILAALLIYKLGSLIGGLNGREVAAAIQPVGWHGIYHDPLYLPIKLVRSIDIFIFKQHGQTLTRLPNTLFGALAIISFAWLIRQWHSQRTALLATVLFMTGAWTLHASRLASFDVLYLWAAPALLLSYSLLQRHPASNLVRWSSLIAWLLLLYVPGMVWLLLGSGLVERKVILASYKKVNFGQWPLYILVKMAAVSLLVIDLFRPWQLRSWLGLPAHFPALHTLLKQELAVPVHLFIRGPEYPWLWLGRAPILDIFTLAASLAGIYFYVTHWPASRSKLLATLALLGGVLVGLGGPVGLSLLVPLLYVAAATGLAYLLHEWLQTFPRNPLARSVGIGIIVVAIGLSAIYNLRSYFVAWPHNNASRAVFQERLPR